MSTNWTYEVDSRGQVVSGQKRVGTSSAGTVFIGWDAAYAYDDIGNRTESRFGGLGGSSDPVGSESITYTTNALNQYEEIANPRAAYVMGTAAYSTSNPALHTEVVINGQTADRSGVNFVQKLVPSGTGPKWEPLNFELVRDSVTQSFQLHLYTPPVQEVLSYDSDGNLTADGRWTYTWDGENRLVGMTTQAVAETVGVPGTRLTFAYDGQSRRVQKKVETRTTSSDPWVLQSDTRFVYDGWNMVGEAEYLATAADAPPTFGGGTAGPYWRRTYVWGEDLSGRLQGAGGVGGLLLINRHERASKPLRTSWATHDLNGNVIGLVESNLKAAYEYDPFGKPLRVSEPEEDLNPFRFSTKYTDAEAGLCCYGYRFYDAVRGRWINRDPIGERGGINLFAMVFNNSVTRWDYLGQLTPIDSLGGGVAGAGVGEVAGGVSSVAALAGLVDELTKDKTINELDFKSAESARIEAAVDTFDVNYRALIRELTGVAARRTKWPFCPCVNYAKTSTWSDGRPSLGFATFLSRKSEYVKAEDARGIEYADAYRDKVRSSQITNNSHIVANQFWGEYTKNNIVLATKSANQAGGGMYRAESNIKGHSNGLNQVCFTAIPVYRRNGVQVGSPALRAPIGMGDWRPATFAVMYFVAVDNFATATTNFHQYSSGRLPRIYGYDGGDLFSSEAVVSPLN